MKTKIDLDLTTILRYIESSYIPSHFEICKKMIENYSKMYEIDVFGTAMLVDALEAKGGYQNDY